ncbi:MAG: aminotransferase class V-fold PLP-dependent enzyme [Ruminococcus sp.]|nr:aminotransferase class V-fold PLP-dependent enzyme [Ruminococcus sp.]
MNTPINDFLNKYNDSGVLRCHMPGHKGHTPDEADWLPYAIDITEISGADSLFEADGIIRQSEENAAKLWGSADTLFSAGGSTLCIQAMLTAMKLEGRRGVAVRNVHRSFLNAAALLDLEVDWLIPDYSGGILSGRIDPEKAADMLDEKSFLYVTSPDYTGAMADIPELSRVCKEKGAMLLVDCAHGAHLPFFETNMHPIALGADICCDSAHKMLPALTGGAMLHCSKPGYRDILRQCMSMFGSTSPSYLIMDSLDLCCRYVSQRIREDIRRSLHLIREFREHFSGQLLFTDGDPFHITIKAAQSGFDGRVLAEEMRKNGAECEYADRELVILLMSPVNTTGEYIQLSHVLARSLQNVPKILPSAIEFTLPVPEQVMSIRQAAFSPSEEIPVTSAKGRICASVKVPCPPAVPIAVSGERITSQHIALFQNYGIDTVLVVKEGGI